MHDCDAAQLREGTLVYARDPNTGTWDERPIIVRRVVQLQSGRVLLLLDAQAGRWEQARDVRRARGTA